MIKYDSIIIKKWRPIIEGIFEIKNDYLINVICVFCEKYSQREYTNLVNTGVESKLPEKLNEIKSKLFNMNSLEIVKSYYNPITGLVIYELENGLMIDERREIQEMDEDKFIQLFGEIGLEILREVDPSKWRDSRLEKILNNG